MATMKKSRVVEILTFYRNIDGEIRLYKSTVADLEAYYEPLSAQPLDGMPRGKNGVSQPTETIALNLPDNLREDIEFYNSKISALYKLKTEILKEVSGLEPKFKCIITDYYLHGLKWEQVSVRNHYSERQCKNIRNTAVETLAARFENNPAIADFKITA